MNPDDIHMFKTMAQADYHMRLASDLFAQLMIDIDPDDYKLRRVFIRGDKLMVNATIKDGSTLGYTISNVELCTIGQVGLIQLGIVGPAGPLTMGNPGVAGPSGCPRGEPGQPGVAGISENNPSKYTHKPISQLFLEDIL